MARHRMKRWSRAAFQWAAGGLLLMGAALAAGPDFATQIQPLLTEHCLKCHGPEKQKGGLRLDSSESALKGGDSGEPAIVPGKPDASRLLKLVIAHDPAERMPPKAPALSDESVAHLRDWILAGAHWPASQPVAARREFTVTADDRNFWAFRPLTTPTVPDGEASSPIDRFIERELAARGTAPAAPADRRTVVRRLCFDLIGMPPTPEQVSAFEQDTRPDAWRRLVDRLLADPRHGERWARHWLDAARYAESDGYEVDADRNHAWPYRDFVIRALNRDLPYDEFVRLQIAGDELAPEDPWAFAATGFCTAGPIVGNGGQYKNRWDELDDVASTIGSAFLGLTVGCARCHDHKYDPVSQRDYYQLVAFFQNARRTEQPLLTPKDRQELDRQTKAWRAAAGELAGKYDSFRDRYVRWQLDVSAVGGGNIGVFFAPDDPRNEHQQEIKARHDLYRHHPDDQVMRALDKEEQRKEWRELQDRLNNLGTPRPATPTKALGLRNTERLPSHLLARGDPEKASADVVPRTLEVLSRPDAAISSPHRRELAAWITDTHSGAGALLARVMVNRVWQHHFGRGLVRTAGDFGAQGETPSHPELLEWLASQFVADGFSLRALHRRIVATDTYRRSSAGTAAQHAADPDHRWLVTFPRRRLEAEALRDSVLAVAGTLNAAQGGPSVRAPVPADAIPFIDDRYDRYPTNVVDSPATWRRTVYLFQKRSTPLPLMQTFDAPTASASCAARVPTVVAPQALSLMNDDFFRDQAARMARRVQQESGGEETAGIRRAFALAYQRNPTATELSRARAFLTAQPGTGWTDLCQALLCSNEFLYAD
jgi:mono/diheme cytochrome c family protein